MRMIVNRQKQQRGIALMVTLIILVVVTVLGLTALRAGFMHVAIATNAQVNTIVFQAADSSTLALERAVNADKFQAMQVDGILGMVPAGGEKTACLTATGMQFATPTSSHNCTLNVASPGVGEWMSGRQIVAVQTTLTSPVGADGNQAKKAQDGTDNGNNGGLPGNTKYVAFSTAVMPAFGGISNASIDTCLAKPADDSADASIVTVSECLSALGASYNTQVQEYIVGFSGPATITN